MTDNKSYLDTFTDKKPESFEQETFVAITDKSRRTKIIIAVIAVVVLIAGSFGIYNLTNNVMVPKLVGMTLDEVNAWATKNRITLAATSIYDFASDSGIVIAQETPAGDSIQKNSVLSIDVSLGADPSEKITWPDIKSMTVTEIEAWISDNKLTGVKIATANSDIVAADQVISYALTDDTEANFTRKSRATVNVSIGPASQSETVVVSDFSSMKAGEVLQWGTDNGVMISISEAFDNYVASGNVVSQSVKANTEINKTEAISVVISIGAPVVVPNFAAMSQDEANSWAKLNNVTLIVQEKYSSSNDKGKNYSQSIASGTTMKAGDELKLVYSLGRVDLASYIGKTKLDILNWQNEVNLKGANISITFTETYGEKGTGGKIVSQSIKNDYVSPGTKISVAVSLGMKLITPDFSGKTEAECSALAQANGIAVLYNYQESSSVSWGYSISQSPAQGTVMTDTAAVTVAISVSGSAVKTVAVPDFSTMGKDEASTWAKTNNVTLTFDDMYMNAVSAGTLYSQSVAAGQSITQGSGITISCSLGQIEMTSFVGKTKIEMLNWLAGVNAKGGNISVAYTYANNMTYAMNIIIGQSIMNTYIDTGTTITFNISWQP